MPACSSRSASRSWPKTSTFSPPLREPRAQLDERGALLALRDVLAAQHARGERADLDAPVADEPRREAVAIGEVGEELERGRDRILAR